MTDTRRIVLVVRNDLTRDGRLQKEARALTDAGYDVWCVGIVTAAGQPERESADFGEVVRVLTTRKLAARPGAPAPSTTLTAQQTDEVYGGAPGALRHFFGRVRENVLLQRTIARLKPDLVVVHDPDSAIAGLLQRLLHRTPLGYDAREVWTEQRPEAHPLFKRLYGWVERRVMRAASYRMTVNDAIAAELERRYGVAPVTTVYNGSAVCLDAPQPVHDPVRLFFQGSFSPDRNLDTLVRAMAHLRGSAMLYLQGYGEMEEPLAALVRELGLEQSVVFVPPCEPADVVRSASDYDVGVICHLPTSLNHRLAAPNKLFDYMGGGLAIAGSDLPVIASIVGENGCGVLIDPSTPASLADGIAALLRDAVRITAMKAASARACRRYAWAEQAKTVLRLVASALDSA